MRPAVAVGERWVVPGNRFDLLPAPSTPPEVTAVVLHYRDPERLALVLAGLRRQTHPAPRLQVVVADDGSVPLPPVPDDVVLVTQEDRGFRAAAARNLGAAAADGEVLCFLDGDTVPEPGYVAAAVAWPAVGTDVLVVGRRRHTDLTGWGPDRLGAWFDGGPAPRELTEPRWLRDAYAGSRDLLDADDRSYRHVISAVLTVHRDLFAATGGFDPTFTGYGGEDWEFAHRAWVAGAVLAHRHDAVAWHDGPDWGEREGGTAAGRAQKERETAELARRIPDHVARGEGFVAAAPRLLAEVGGGTSEQRVGTVRALLVAHPDTLLVTDGVTAATVDDPRVVAELPDRGTVQRIPYRVRVDAPAVVDDLGTVVDGLTGGDAGRVVTADGRVVVEAARAVNRAARHGLPLERLFGTDSAPASGQETP